MAKVLEIIILSVIFGILLAVLFSATGFHGWLAGYWVGSATAIVTNILYRDKILKI